MSRRETPASFDRLLVVMLVRLAGEEYRDSLAEGWQEFAALAAAPVAFRPPGTLFMADRLFSSIAAAVALAAETHGSFDASAEVTGLRLVPKQDRRQVLDRRCVYRGGRREIDRARVSVSGA